MLANAIWLKAPARTVDENREALGDPPMTKRGQNRL